MIRLGLIGYPVEHSLSPLLHEAALRAAGLQGAYVLYPVRPDNMQELGTLVKRVRSGELTGLNITIPHKQAIMQFMDRLTPAAEEIGAVNTIYRRDGKVVGDNTDAGGFIADLDRFAPACTAAAVLGAGGAARAVAYALRKRQSRVWVAARRLQRAQELARRFAGVEAIDMDRAALVRINPDLIVNATPAGMFPHIADSPWPTDLALPERAAIYDLVYNPAETKLVRLAKAAGLRATTGLGMLVEQALLAFELWTGYKVERQVMLQAIAQAVQQ